jgi:hypothetical protein
VLPRINAEADARLDLPKLGSQKDRDGDPLSLDDDADESVIKEALDAAERRRLSLIAIVAYI